MAPGSLRNLLSRDPFLPLVIRRRDGTTIRATLPEQVRLLPGNRILALCGIDERSFSQVQVDEIADIALESVPSDYDVVDGVGKARVMTIEKFDEFLRRKPFVPFTVHTADGGSFEVKSPEFSSRTQGGRTIFVSTGGEATEWIDLLLVSRISSGVSNIGASGPPSEPSSKT